MGFEGFVDTGDPKVVIWTVRKLDGVFVPTRESNLGIWPQSRFAARGGMDVRDEGEKERWRPSGVRS